MARMIDYVDMHVEMWVWRWLKKVSWKDKITNEAVLEMVEERKSLINTIQNRQRNWIGHVLRGDSLLRDVIEGRMEGSKGKGRPRIMLLDWMMDKDKKLRYRRLKEEANNREEWRQRRCHEPAARQSTWEREREYGRMLVKAVRSGYQQAVVVRFCGAVVRAFDSFIQRSRVFESRPLRCYVAALGKLFKHLCLLLRPHHRSFWPYHQSFGLISTFGPITITLFVQKMVAPSPRFWPNHWRNSGYRPDHNIIKH